MGTSMEAAFDVMTVNISIRHDVNIVNMASRKRTPAPRTAYHHGDLRNALVDAAERLIESGGGARLTLRAAAEAAGVSVAAPYRHFADREALLAAVLAQGFRELARRTATACRAAAEPMDALVAVGLAYVAFAADRPAIYRLMFGPECDKAAHPDLMAAGHEAFGVLVEAVAQARAAGLIGDADPHAVALAGWSMSHGLASLHADGILAATLPVDLPTAARALMGMLVDGVRPRRSVRPRR
jgi:AcrR family transcriptional regulator